MSSNHYHVCVPHNKNATVEHCLAVTTTICRQTERGTQFKDSKPTKVIYLYTIPQKYPETPTHILWPSHLLVSPPVHDEEGGGYEPAATFKMYFA